MNTTQKTHEGATVQIMDDVAAFNCQTKEQTMLPAGCVLAVEAHEPRDPAAYSHGDGYLVWLLANECNDPVEDMRAERWYIADAEQLHSAGEAR